jgi:hypothetical protein
MAREIGAGQFVRSFRCAGVRINIRPFDWIYP